VATFFLGCFSFGLIFTVASFLLGAFGSGHVHLHLHLPSLHLLGGHHGGGGAHGGQQGTTLSPFNVSTISAFLTWFGGAGYLLSLYSSLTAVGIVALSGVAGAAGGGIIFVTLSRYVLPRLTEMRAEDYELPGTVARVTSTIHAGGTGEIVYTLAGTHRADGARSVSGEALERGTEVVILRVERGIAYVERWDSYARRLDLPSGDADQAKPEIGP
jgi:membrane protein implicated in regulation of membrane protease activity